MHTISRIELLDYRFTLTGMWQRLNARRQNSSSRRVRRSQNERLDTSYYDGIYRRKAISTLRKNLTGCDWQIGTVALCVALLAVSIVLLITCTTQLRPDLRIYILAATGGIVSWSLLTRFARDLHTELVKADFAGIVMVLRVYERRQLRTARQLTLPIKPFLRPHFPFSYICIISNNTAG